MLQKLCLLLCFVVASHLRADIPRVIITTSTAVISKEDGVPGTLSVKDGTTIYPIELKRRGSSSYIFKQRQYTLEFKTEYNVPLLNLPAHKKWVLHGPYVDRSLIRNALVYDVGQDVALSRSGRIMGTAQPSNNDVWFAPKTRFFELEMNGSYEGVYLLVEKIEADKSRLHLTRNFDPSTYDESPVSYFAKIESKNIDVSTSHNTHIQFGEPSLKKIEALKTLNPALANNLLKNIKTDFENLETSFLNTPTDSLAFSSHIDLNSLVDYVLIQEVFKNIDGYRRSVYLHKNPDEPFKMGPLWDFNLGLGNVWFYSQHKPQGWNIEKDKFIDGNQPAFWFAAAFQNKAFLKALSDRYHALRVSGQPLSKHVLFHKIQIFESLLGSSLERHAARWKHIRHPLHAIFFNSPHWESHPQKCILKLSKWLDERLDWMDLNL